MSLKPFSCENCARRLELDWIYWILLKQRKECSGRCSNHNVVKNCEISLENADNLKVHDLNIYFVYLSTRRIKVTDYDNTRSQK